MKRSSSSSSSASKSVATQPEDGATRPFFGEQTCAKCQRRTAYYWANNSAMCGMCSRTRVRSKLRVNPNAAQIKADKQAAHMQTVEAARTPGAGSVVVMKMHMMRNPEQTPGVLLVFPNYKHGGRTDGLGLPELSPKSMGPIDHKQPGLPIARNLENFHQGAKFWPFELDEALQLPTQAAIDARRRMYEDPEPHRHKHSPQTLAKYGNINKPSFSLYYCKDGHPHRYSYLECRYFYCYWYERLAPQTAAFRGLKERLERGYHLAIVGYDGYPVLKTLWEHYNDTSVPFGHELVLYTLLTQPNKEEYPWRRFYRENASIYKDVIPYPDW